jgi:chemotaxis protein MotB
LPSPALLSGWQQTAQPVFVVEDSFYRSRIPRPAHWSIAWSDLMMTMFVLFLTLFVHQRTQQEIAAHGSPNRVADETLPVQAEEAGSTLVFHPITQQVSRRRPAPREQAEPARREQSGADVLIRHRLAEEPKPPAPTPAAAESPAAASADSELITGLYDLSRVTVAAEKLERFASVELVPDKAMRISLTGDLLFPSAQADLTPAARAALDKLVPVIVKTPYMINVIGHTDDRPMQSARYPSNWELSLARASQVARFLIETSGLPAGQFSVSGHASFRPVQPNTSEEGRHANRRVELILSREPVAAENPPAATGNQPVTGRPSR